LNLDDDIGAGFLNKPKRLMAVETVTWYSFASNLARLKALTLRRARH
jgi:hypothetical protein